MLDDLCDGLLASSPAPALRVRELVLDLPVEVALEEGVAGSVLAADVPRWRWRTDFDQRVSRLRVRIGEQPAVAP
jgi:hypothetical protein